MYDKKHLWKCVRNGCGGILGKIYAYSYTSDDEEEPLYDILVDIEGNSTTTSTMISESNSGKEPGYIKINR